MATKEELLNELTVSDLKDLASDNEVDVPSDANKPDLVEALNSSRRVTKADVQRVLDEQADGSRVDVPSDTTPLAAAGTTPTADAGDGAAPSPGANVGGTAINQLNLAPPMIDESGSNIGAANLRQPVASENVGTDASTVSPASLDPALTDPVGTARARVEGRTSDASNRSADVRAGDVPPDRPVGGDKPSDGGPELYPFPPGGDVDVATVNAGSGNGEYFPNLEIGDSVVLDGSHELVPDRLDGRRGLVTDAPRYLVPMADAGNVWFTCVTRDETNTTLHIPLSATKSVDRGGVVPTVRG